MVFFRCDGCSKESPALDMRGSFKKPADWYQRHDQEGTQVACSIDCARLVADKTGKSGVIKETLAPGVGKPRGDL